MEPYAWTVTAIVPDDPDKMPADKYGRGLWAASSSEWMRAGLRAHRYGQCDMTPGRRSSKTFTREATAKAQATHARKCGFIVEVTPLYADATDWKSAYDELKKLYDALVDEHSEAISTMEWASGEIYYLATRVADSYD